MQEKLSLQDFEQDEEDSQPDIHFTEEDGTEGLSPGRRPRSSNPMAGLLPVEETGSHTHILIDEIGDNRAHALSLENKFHTKEKEVESLLGRQAGSIARQKL